MTVEGDELLEREKRWMGMEVRNGRSRGCIEGLGLGSKSGGRREKNESE